MYQRILKPLLFSFPPERAHHLTVGMLSTLLKLPGGRHLVEKRYQYDDEALKTEFCGLTFKNPVGLAAGFDKDGKYFHHMAALGFGHIEIGTVTPLPQKGNPSPRLFRLPLDNALINRMGFNNDGVDAMVERLKKGKPKGVIIGGNIGKNKNTPNEKAIDDYVICFKKLHSLVDYFVVNVSSPNTPGLRELQEKEPLSRILSELKTIDSTFPVSKPILLKIAPDLNDSQLDDILSIIKSTGTDGLVATNTTLSREALLTPQNDIHSIGQGGLSGKPLHSKSTHIIQYLHSKSGSQLPIIGVGGIGTPSDAMDKIKAGASLIQIYTGMVYSGPALVRNINEQLLKSRIE